MSNSYIGHLLFIGGEIKRETFEEFDTSKELVKGVKGRQKLTSIKFKLESNDK